MSNYITPKSQIENVRNMKIYSYVDTVLGSAQEEIIANFVLSDKLSFNYTIKKFGLISYVIKDVLIGVAKELTKGGYEVELFTEFQNLSLENVDAYFDYIKDNDPVIKVSR